MGREKEVDINKSLLEVRSLKTFYYNQDQIVKAVNDVSFSLAPGSRLGISGESGSGKTQTVLSIMGLIRDMPGIVDGEIIIQGHNVLEDLDRTLVHKAGSVSSNRQRSSWQSVYENKMAKIRGSVLSMIFQEPKSALIPYYSIQAHFEETLLHLRSSLNESERGEIARGTLQHLNFDNPSQTLAQFPHQLSGGEAQRVMIGLSMLGDPKILIADEPTTALDTVTQRSVIDELMRTVMERNMGLIFISHNLAVMAHMVEYIAVMFAGQIVEYGKSSEIISRHSEAMHPYTVELLSAFLPTNQEPSKTKGREAIDLRKNTHGCVFYFRCELRSGLSEGIQSRCKSERPPLIKVQSDRQVACWSFE